MHVFPVHVRKETVETASVFRFFDCLDVSSELFLRLSEL